VKFIRVIVGRNAHVTTKALLFFIFVEGKLIEFLIESLHLRSELNVLVCHLLECLLCHMKLGFDVLHAHFMRE